jgi:hypothetical protein
VVDPLAGGGCRVERPQGRFERDRVELSDQTFADSVLHPDGDRLQLQVRRVDGVGGHVNAGPESFDGDWLAGPS